MSMMTVHCDWCGQDYTFGIVGQEQLGGHLCQAEKPCADAECEELGVVHVEANHELKFVCWSHIPDDALILGAQSRVL